MAAPTPLPPLNLSAGGGGPSTAGGTFDNLEKNSWVVNFGSGQAGATGSNDGGAMLGAYGPYILGGVALLIVWRLTRKR